MSEEVETREESKQRKKSKRRRRKRPDSEPEPASPLSAMRLRVKRVSKDVGAVRGLLTGVYGTVHRECVAHRVELGMLERDVDACPAQDGPERDRRRRLVREVAEMDEWLRAVDALLAERK